MNRLLARLVYGGKPDLRAYEKKCLTAFREALQAAAKPTFDEQIARVDLIQRYAADKLVTFHFVKNERNLPLFGNRAAELNAGRAQLRLPNRGNLVTCNLVLHEGRLSSIEFNVVPKPLLKQEFEIRTVDLFTDVSVSLTEESVPTTTSVIMDDLRADLHIEVVKPPLAQSSRYAYISSLVTVVTGDYEQLLAETNGFQSGEWLFLGSNSRRIIRPDSTYIIVAESPTRAICFKESDSTGVVYLYDQIDDDMQESGRAFVTTFKLAVVETT